MILHIALSFSSIVDHKQNSLKLPVLNYYVLKRTDLVTMLIR